MFKTIYRNHFPRFQLRKNSEYSIPVAINTDSISAIELIELENLRIVKLTGEMKETMFSCIDFLNDEFRDVLDYLNNADVDFDVDDTR